MQDVHVRKLEDNVAQEENGKRELVLSIRDVQRRDHTSNLRVSCKMASENTTPEQWDRSSPKSFRSSPTRNWKIQSIGRMRRSIFLGGRSVRHA